MHSLRSHAAGRRVLLGAINTPYLSHRQLPPSKLCNAIKSNHSRTFAITTTPWKEQDHTEKARDYVVEFLSNQPPKYHPKSKAIVPNVPSRNAKRGKRARAVHKTPEMKTIVAYCVAEEYDISKVAELLEDDHYELDPHHTGLGDEIIHVQVGNMPDLDGPGDVFVFSSGTIVAWNTAEETIDRLRKRMLQAATNPHPKEVDSLKYREEPSTHSSKFVGDTLYLGTGQRDMHPNEHHPVSVETSNELSASIDSPKRDLALVKIAFSYGIARSTKISVLESSFESYFERIRSIPVELQKAYRVPFTRSSILRLTGELLGIRAQLNLYSSELTDSLPDLFWDSEYDLGLERYYDSAGRTLDVNVRIATLNNKMDYAQEIATVAREILSERHGLRLEWAIIILIMIEVALEMNRLWQEHAERNDPDNLEALLKGHFELER
ncbi:hypothetical protein K402DRAFT_452895 [Aulographum hederae CBS 113979]|uniref:DUF155 domain-containing protein n=1 Tax=Aulographum hederae CBS 113979 TaxID=1176131 RepID=A0A6G1H4L6_9PEZI|nr:hypothetical protein K402DRAFT_452895 [Aulographum hederae CBS 113979]